MHVLLVIGCPVILLAAVSIAIVMHSVALAVDPGVNAPNHGDCREQSMHDPIIQVKSRELP